MDAIDLREWIEELILTREAARNEAAHWQAENEILKYTIALLEHGDTVKDDTITQKDVEIARLTALLNVPPQPAQEQADEHPAKKGWLQLNDRTITAWSPDEAGVKHKTHGRTWAMQYLAVYPDRLPEAIAAYDRYMAQQEGGQAQ